VKGVTAESATAAVGIRRVEIADAPLIEQYASDARIAETSHVPHPYPRGGGLRFAASAVAAWNKGNERTFMVTEHGALAGLVSLMAVNRVRASAQVGYWIAVPYWGRGIASEALRLAVQFGFGELHLVELGAGCLAVNGASARVLEKNGFVEQAPYYYAGPDERFRGQKIRAFLLSRPRTDYWGSVWRNKGKNAQI
jgi:[ribosomal protein S5]-alanine N-acetyltransferase